MLKHFDFCSDYGKLGCNTIYMDIVLKKQVLKLFEYVCN